MTSAHVTIVYMPTPALMSVEEFAHMHGISTSTAYKCIRGGAENFPPLRAKRTKPGKGGEYRITTEQAAEWRANLPDA
ncbi:helix-turn-helix domain-containing protein [Arcanobacterium haemolyticum]|nr:helix-turn-helix domain-containing protein [Arcanobacterium haemolyticum]